ncbi:MAG: hypothetical protein HC899_11620, partial [Leptolyngbyaceae cyanobacterium SM1_4_3]|nr:hypothetical protein [Leptolyngbyaceae cyanobacterium SM1_4_3]
MMPSKLTFHKQEKPYSCVPVCLRMVLSGFGLSVSDEKTDNPGTPLTAIPKVLMITTIRILYPNPFDANHSGL